MTTTSLRSPRDARCSQFASLGPVGREVGGLIRGWADALSTFDWASLRTLVAGRRFKTVTADPPWRWNDRGSRMAPDQKGKRARKKGYETLPLQDICAMPVPEIVEDDAHLYLWCPDALLWSHALPVLICWGFTPVLLLKWVKCQQFGTPAWYEELSRDAGGRVRHVLGGLQIGGGHYWRRATEVAVFAVRGRLPVPPANRLNDVLFAPRERNAASGEKHSTKPGDFLTRVEKVSPGPYLELFARTGREGWTSFGDQL